MCLLAQTNSESSHYVRWDAPGLPAVVIRRSVAGDILADVLRGLNSVPKRGVETGGLLLGRRVGDEFQVERFEPVTCEYRFGPSFRLSEGDREALEATLGRLAATPPDGVAVVGFYRSHTRPDFSLDAEDAALMAEYFSDPAQMLLLIKPNRWQQSVADCFFWSDGELRQALHVEAFPFERAAGPVSKPAPKAIAAPAAPAPKTEPRPVLAPLPPLATLMTREHESPAPVRRSWIWGAVAAVIAIVSGAFVYQFYYRPGNGPSAPRSSAADLHISRPEAAAAHEPAPGGAAEPHAASPQPAGEMATQQSSPTPPLQPGASSPPPAETAAAHEPAPGVAPPAAAPQPPERPQSARNEPAAPASPAHTGSERSEITALLNRWAGSIRTGDAKGLARCYAPLISRYYTKRNAKPGDTGKRLAYLRGRYGKFAIHRVADLSITPVNADMAFATFTKHWETAGRKKQAGEEQQRMTLVRTGDGWKIAAEEVTRVSWSLRDR
jgi:ketosteroid isomerase-like protein